MRSSRTGVGGVLLALAMAAACGVNEVSYEGKSCPCPSGYRCDHATNRCTTHAGANGGTSGDEGGEPGVGGGSGGSTTGGGGTGNAGSDTGGSGNASGQGGTSGSGTGGTSGGTTGGTSGRTTGGSGGLGGTGLGGSAGTTNPSNCVRGDACETLPNHGLDIVAVRIDPYDWTDCSKNCLGIYTTIVGHTHDEAELTVDVSTGNICMSGFARLNGAAEIDIALGDFNIADPAKPERAISGFEFTVEGSAVPAAMQFGYYMAEDALNPRCVELAPPDGHHSVRFDEVHLVCGTEFEVGTLSFVHVMNVSVFIPSYGGDVSFDFCLTGLAAVR